MYRFSHPVVIPPSPERPAVSKQLAIHLAELHYDIQVVNIIEFESYGDRNFCLRTIPKTAASCEAENDQNKFVLKILNHVDSAVEGMVEAQNGAMLFLKNQGLDCTVPVESTSGSYIVYYDCSERIQGDERRDKESGKMNAVRLMRYVPGDILKNVAVLTEDLLFELGQYVGKMDKILKDYHYPCLGNLMYSWDLAYLRELKPYISAKYLGGIDRQNLVKNVYEKYFGIVPQVLEKCSKQVIHNDINESNIIVTQEEASDATEVKCHISGVIDFGDMCYSYRVFEIAIAMAQIIILNYCNGNPRPFESAGKLLEGYQSVYPLSKEERSIIYWCIAGRLIQILILGSKKVSIDQGNEHVNELLDKVWKVLPEYLKFSDVELLGDKDLGSQITR